MNCIIAQSGGPTTVINSSIYGVIKENQRLGIYKNVLGGINGIEGILAGKIINLSELDNNKLERIKNSPASALGSCRYKLDDYRKNSEEYEKIINILIENDIKTFFYIGGNDSMDTVVKLGEYAEFKNIPIKFIGIPKTIDNDLMYIDHCPGFASSAKFIYTSVLETYLDSVVYSKNGIFIVEVMGRDTGWLAIAGGLAKVNGKECADLLYIPEIPFNEEEFLKDAKRIYNEKKSLYIVVAEGVKNIRGDFISSTADTFDKFAHSHLGGVGQALKHILIRNEIAKKVRVLELNTLQRAAMHCVSKIDLKEAEQVGRYALENSLYCKNGSMVSITVEDRLKYKSKPYLIEAKKVANKTKFVPIEWIKNKGNILSKEATMYIESLIGDEGEYPLNYETLI
ncbi:MAG: 6-phosphofructokinase [Sarcina sp.]